LPDPGRVARLDPAHNEWRKDPCCTIGRRERLAGVALGTAFGVTLGFERAEVKTLLGELGIETVR
jgi:hypothetical protein